MVAPKAVQVQISAPNIQTAQFKIVGVSPYVQARFSQKAIIWFKQKKEGGSTGNSKRATREKWDSLEEAKGGMHISTEGWPGIPAASFRKAIISACRLVNFKMTLAKLSVFVPGDGLDEVDNVGLVRLYGDYEPFIAPTRNATGVFDLRSRMIWKDWYAVLRVQYDADQFSLQDITNLIARVGMQVGIGEGRPDSRDSAGMGWGLFKIAEE